MDRVNYWLPILSLVVAALAIFFGPLISWLVARSQIQSSLKAANKQILAPMRQQWIEALRGLIAELASEAHYLYIAAEDEETDKGSAKNERARRRMFFLEQKVSLMLDPNEADHQDLIKNIRALVQAGECYDSKGPEFGGLHKTVTELSRRVFKRECPEVRRAANPAQRLTRQASGPASTVGGRSKIPGSYSTLN